LTPEMTFGRGHPLEYKLKNVVSCYLLSDQGFVAGSNLSRSTVRVQRAGVYKVQVSIN